MVGARSIIASCKFIVVGCDYVRLFLAYTAKRLFTIVKDVVFLVLAILAIVSIDSDSL